MAKSDEGGGKTGSATHKNSTRSQGKHPRRVPAGEFKATCLKLMDEVEETGEEIIITKRNHPVARLAPVRSEGLRPFIGRSRGVISASREDLLAPIGEHWEVDADL